MLWEGEPVRTVGELELPEGSSLDPAFVLAVATRTNAAHAALGTELLGLEPRGAAIRVAWRPDLTADATGSWAVGVVSALVDHVCSLAALVALDDPRRYGGTMGLRVDHLRPPGAAPALIAHGRSETASGPVLRVHALVYAAGDRGEPVAAGLCTIAVDQVDLEADGS